MSTEPTPTSAQISTARDAATLAKLVLSGQEDATHDLIQALLNDPESIPGVLFGLCGLVAHALPQDVEPADFFEAVNSTLDETEKGANGC